MGKTISPTDRDLQKQIGKNLRTQRLRANISREELADALGCVHQTIAKYESGTIRLAAHTLTQIVRFIKCPVTSIIPPEPSKPGDSSKPTET